MLKDTVDDKFAVEISYRERASEEGNGRMEEERKSTVGFRNALLTK